MDVIRAVSVSWILRSYSMFWTKVAGKEPLGASIPTVFQGDILGNLLNAVRVRRDDQDSILLSCRQQPRIEDTSKHITV